MSRALDRLTLLASFVRIAEAGSISAAARDLGLTQPTASRHLAELEQRLETTLIRRTTHELSLTQAGEALIASARDLLAGWESIEERHGDAERIAGTLRVVAPIALGQTLLGDFACRFQHDHPNIVLHWELNDREIRFATIGCDCWIRVGHVPDDTLVVRELASVERLLVASPRYLAVVGYPRSARALEKLSLLALEPFEGQAVPLTSRNGQSVTIRPPVRLVTNNVVALRTAALAGLGVAVLPRWFVRDALAEGTLVEPLPALRAPRLSVHVAWAPARFQSRRLATFVARLRAEVPALLAAEDAPRGSSGMRRSTSRGAAG